MAKWTGPSLSPTNVKTFEQCPLQYKFRVIDKIVAPPSIEAFRGTVVHQIIENLFKLPKEKRTIDWAKNHQKDALNEVLSDSYNSHYKEMDQVKILLDSSTQSETEQDEFWTKINILLENYFKLENPHLLTPTALEKWVETFIDVMVEDGEVQTVRLGGFIDRLEEKPGVGVRISDYKTGKKPVDRYQEDALFQMWFYSYIYLKANGELPKQVKLIYLGDGQILAKSPDENIVQQLEDKLKNVWVEIDKCIKNNNWPSKTGPLCPWCGYQDRCPEMKSDEKSIDKNVSNMSNIEDGEDA